MFHSYFDCLRITFLKFRGISANFPVDRVDNLKQAYRRHLTLFHSSQLPVPVQQY